MDRDQLAKECQRAQDAANAARAVMDAAISDYERKHRVLMDLENEYFRELVKT